MKYEDSSGKRYRKTHRMFRDQVKLMNFQSYWDVDPSAINSSVE